jgi:hypothetical protein
MIRWFGRKTGLGCFCCGRIRGLLWRKGDHELAVVTVCRECKFGACEECA